MLAFLVPGVQMGGSPAGAAPAAPVPMLPMMGVGQ
jgi:hypothetical protein